VGADRMISSCPQCGLALSTNAPSERCPRCRHALGGELRARGFRERHPGWFGALSVLTVVAVVGSFGYWIGSPTGRTEPTTSTPELPPPLPGNGGHTPTEEVTAGEIAVPSELEVGEITVAGRVAQPLIMAALKQRRAAIETCHRPRVPLERGQRSAVRAQWVIDRAGTVSHVTLRSSDLSSSGDACLIAALEAMVMPAPAGGVVTVLAELAFTAR
jgi:hypothetical protein